MNRRTFLELCGFTASSVILAGCNKEEPSPTLSSASTSTSEPPEMLLVAPGKLPTPIPVKNGFSVLEDIGVATADINGNFASERLLINGQAVLFFTNTLPEDVRTVNEGVTPTEGYLLCITGDHTATDLGGLNPLEPERQEQARMEKGGLTTDNTQFSCYSGSQNMGGLRIGQNASLTILSQNDLDVLFPHR